MRRLLIVLLTFLSGIYYFLEYVLPEETGLSRWIAPVGQVTLVIGTFAIGLGVINLLRLHTVKITRLRPGWFNSLMLILAMVAMATFELWRFYSDREWVDRFRDFLFFNVMVPLESTTFALLAFYVASAAYRAFRIKSAEAAVMMGAALVVMLGQIPVGTWLTEGWSELPPYGEAFQVQALRDWIMNIWNGAAQRGLIFGSMVGAIALTLRIWLGLEKGSFFEDQG
jgi:hypothetical protein